MKIVALLLVVVSTLVLSGCGNSNNGQPAAVPTTYGTPGYGATGYGAYGAGYAGAYPGYGYGTSAYPGYGYPGVGVYGAGQPCDTYIAGSCGYSPSIVCIPQFGQRIGVCQPIGYAH